MTINKHSKEALEYFFHHVFLPSKLPNGDDTSDLNELCLLTFVKDSLCEFLSETDSKHHGVINTARLMMQNMIDARGINGHLEEPKVERILKALHSPGMLSLIYSVDHFGATDFMSCRY